MYCERSRVSDTLTLLGCGSRALTLYSFASFHVNPLSNLIALSTASQLPSPTAHCVGPPANPKLTYLLASALVATLPSTIRLNPSPATRANRTTLSPTASRVRKYIRTRCDERHHVPRSNQTPVVEPRQTARLWGLRSQAGSDGS